MTPAERQQLKRDRRKAGLVRLEVWVPKAQFETVSKAIDRILSVANESNPNPVDE